MPNEWRNKWALVTGASAGIGVALATELAAGGTHLLLSARRRDRLEALAQTLKKVHTIETEVFAADLADRDAPEKIFSFAKQKGLDIELLVNNAGLMGTPYCQTADGLELQMATNHFGHFALTGLLLERIVTTERSRIVTVSSHMHRIGRLHLDDPAGTTRRDTWVTYGTSKLANLLFTLELSRRLNAAGLPTRAVAAHPGWTRSNLAGNGAALGPSRVRRKLARTAGTTLGQSTASGALPVLCAATSPAVHNGQYVGPARAFGLAGPPRLAHPSRRARDEQAAAALWAASEELTGVRDMVAFPA